MFRVRARIGLVLADEDITGFVVPRRNAMAPPERAADAPVLDIVEPLRVSRAPVLRHESDRAIAYSGECGFGDRLSTARPGLAIDTHVGSQIEEPLIGQHRLDHRAGTV